VSNTHLPPVINRATKGNGAPLVVIDPRETGMAKRADLHLPIRPGTDVVIAMATAAELDRRNALDVNFISAHTNGFEAFLTACSEWSIARAADECDIEPAAIEQFCDLLSVARRPFFRLGWGMERNRNGGSGLQAALGLRLAIGRFGTRGSGIVGSTSGRAWNAQAFMTAPTMPTPRRAVNQNLLGQLLTAPGDETPIDVLFVQGANPALMNPNQAAVIQGLAREDLFAVVHDQVLTDTARWADVVLPATTHFEAADAKGSYGTHIMLTWDAVIPRVGDSRTNAEVVRALAIALGLSADDFPDDPHTLIERGLVGGPGTGVLRQPDESVQFRDLWPAFDDRKARFIATTYERVTADHPLTLLSPASTRTINSIFGERPAEPKAHLHADDAAARGIADGAMVRVFNERGSVVVSARLDGEARPGVVVITKGDWSRNFPAANGLSVNVLTTDDIDPLAGGACFNDTRVDVALAG
jgi:anaerobic selenocysteine-containing dehydrogenase